jgi:2,4-dienoyl-CoA reductase-like NADH-dependent reductase (Old Yellow Enzyme family)
MTSRYSDEFITEVEDFLASTRMKATDFGRESVGDPNFIRHLRKGRSPSLLTADRVCAFMEKVRQSRQASGKRTKLP